MKTRINTYDDLVKHEQELEELLHAQKELVVYDFKALKEEFKPATKALNLLGKFTTKDRTNNPLVTEGTNRVIDFVVRNVLLSRAGWFTRFAVPALLKNYSSHFISSHKDDWKSRLFSWVNRKNGHGKVAPQAQKTGPDLPDAE